MEATGNNRHQSTAYASGWNFPTSQSPYTAPVVLVRKPDGTWRFCIDYRKLNAITIKDVNPLLRIDDALSRLEGSKYFSIMYLQSGYWQVQMHSSDREKTAFITADGL